MRYEDKRYVLDWTGEHTMVCCPKCAEIARAYQDRMEEVEIEGESDE